MNNAANPYRSPEVADRPNLVEWPYVSGHARARATNILLALCVVVQAIAILPTAVRLTLLVNARKTWTLSLDDLMRTGLWQLWLMLAVGALGMLAGVPFLMWSHRVHRNLRALRVDEIVYSPGWAVGGWFIPLLNLFRPCPISTICTDGRQRSAFSEEPMLAGQTCTDN